MIKCDNQIRLTAVERQQLRYLTGAETSNIKTMRELEKFIKDQLNDQPYCGPGMCLARRVLASYLYL